jgi:hypothetical protein
MRKISKVVMIVGLLLLLLIFFFGMIVNQQAVDLPFYLIPLREYPWIGASINMFLFWACVGFALLTIIGIIVVLFFPSRSDQLVIQQKTGELVIQKKALEHFVLQKVQQADFIHSPSVKVKIIKHKVRVMIDGEMKQTAAIPQQQEALVGEISNQLQTLFGVTHDIQTEVVLKDAEETREHHTQPRVV